MFKNRNAYDSLRTVTRVQWGMIAALLLALYGAGIGWNNAAQRQTLYIPPDLRDGATVRAGEVTPSAVYDFAAQLFAMLNHWPTDGAEDWPARLYQLAPYMTPGYRAQVEAELVEATKEGETTGRTRGVQLLPGAIFSPDRVQQLAPGRWVAWLDVEVAEYVAGSRVKLAYIRYPLRVVRYRVDPALNPYGLALDGYATDPRRLTAEELDALGVEQ